MPPGTIFELLLMIVLQWNDREGITATLGDRELFGWRYGTNTCLVT